MSFKKTNLIIDLKYSGTDNFIGQDVYGCLDRCFLQPEVASMLRKAHDLLKKPSGISPYRL